MRNRFWIVVLATMITGSVNAQEYPNIQMIFTAGVGALACVTPPDNDLAKACFVRTDLVGDPLDLGCVDAPLPNTAYPLQMSVEVTPGQDANIRCYVVDTSGNHSNISDNFGFADFTAPGTPRIEAPSEPIVFFDQIIARERMFTQKKTMTLEAIN